MLQSLKHSHKLKYILPTMNSQRLCIRSPIQNVSICLVRIIQALRLSIHHLPIGYEITYIGSITQTKPISILKLSYNIRLLQWKQLHKLPFNSSLQHGNSFMTVHHQHHLLVWITASVCLS